MANAQLLSLGMKAGLNISDPSGYDYNAKLGYHAGIVGRLKVGALAVQPEVVFSQQGANVTMTGGPNRDQEMNYLTVPLMLQLYVFPGFYLEAGPQVGILISSNISSPYRDLSRRDYALNGGAGFRIRPISTDIYFRYSAGLKDIEEGMWADGDRHRVVQLGLLYRF